MKRRPSWSDRLRWVVALFGSLLLLHMPAAWAKAAGTSAKKSETSSAHKASARHGGAKAGKKPGRTVVRHARTLGRNNLKHRSLDSAEPEILTAEIKDEADTGLRGMASFYAYGFQGRRTATGEVFRVQEFTAASNRFPLGTMVAVRRLDSSRCAIVKVNDRMHPKHRKRIIDVSRGVAEYLDMIRAGVVLVRVARLKDGWREHGTGACHAAFEAEASGLGDKPAPPLLPLIGGESLN